MLSTNVLGTCLCTRAVLLDMVARHSYGHIINIVGLSAHRIPDGPQVEVPQQCTARAVLRCRWWCLYGFCWWRCFMERGGRSSLSSQPLDVVLKGHFDSRNRPPPLLPATTTAAHSAAGTRSLPLPPTPPHCPH